MYVLKVNNVDINNSKINSDIDDEIYEWKYGLGHDHLRNAKIKSFHEFTMVQVMQ